MVYTPTYKNIEYLVEFREFYAGKLTYRTYVNNNVYCSGSRALVNHMSSTQHTHTHTHTHGTPHCKGKLPPPHSLKHTHACV